MKTFALTLLALCGLALAGPADAQYCRAPGRGTLPAYTPTRTTYAAPAYSAPATVYAPPKTTYAPTYRTHDYATRIVFADAVFQVTDYNVRDLFVFTGPPAVLPVGVTFGVAANGREVLAPVAPPVAQAPPPPPVAPPRFRDVVADDQSADAGSPLAGYTPDAEIAKYPARKADVPKDAGPSALAFAALRTSCASCHTAGSEKGGFVLFSADGSPKGLDAGGWKSVLEVVVSADGKSAPRMPPAGKGPPLSADAVAAVRAGAGFPAKP